MREWWQSLERRERLLVAIAGAFVVAAIIYAAIWEPLSGSITRLSARVNDQRALVAWLHDIGPRVQTLRAGTIAPENARDRERSLLSVIDRTSKQSGLGDAVTRIQPDGDTRVRVWLANADFDHLVRWLFELRRHYGVHSESALVNAEDQGGVGARLSLVRGAE